MFFGEKLLTTPNPGEARDLQLLERLGMHLQATDPTEGVRALVG